MRMGHKSSNWCPYKKRGLTKTHREESHVKTEGAEIGVMLPQSKERQEPQEAGRGKKGFSL